MRTVRLSLLTCSFLAACGSVPTRTFEFAAINVEENAVPCLVVVDQDWVGANDKQQVVNLTGNNTLKLPVRFDRAEVEVTVAAVLPNLDTGALDWTPTRSTDTNPAVPYRSQSRILRVTDPKKQLFILSPR